MATKMDENERRSEYLRNFIANQNSYRNQKEYMAFGGFAFYVLAFGAAYASRGWHQGNCVSMLFTIFAWIAILIFLKFQLWMRRIAAIRIEEAQKIYLMWAMHGTIPRFPDEPEKRQSDWTNWVMNNWQAIIGDMILPKRELYVPRDHQLIEPELPKAFSEWELHEWLLQIVGWALFLLVLGRSDSLITFFLFMAWVLAGFWSYKDSRISGILSVMFFSISLVGLFLMC